MKKDDNDTKHTENPVQVEESAVQDVLSPALPEEASLSGSGPDEEGGEHVAAAASTERQAAGSEEAPAATDTEPAPSIGEIIRQEVKEGEEVPPGNFTMSKVLGGTLILSIFQRQVKLVLLITVFLIIYITCRYQCQKQMVEIDRLESRLVTIRYKATVYSCELTEMSRESNILELLEQRGDSTLVIPKEPPYKINIPE